MTSRGRRNSVRASILKIFGKRPDIEISDPILPPGGLPLPAITKRKPSTTHELPAVYRLSVLPDFTSSKIHFRTPELDTSLLPGRSQNVEKPLLIRYSLVSQESEPQSASKTPTRTLRKIKGRQTLRASDDGASSIFGSSVDSSADDSLCTGSGVSSTDSLQGLVKEQESTNHSLERAKPHVNHCKLPSFEELEKKTDYLLESFCILDWQLPGHPVSVTSADLLPKESLAESETLFLENGNGRKVWEIQRSAGEAGDSYHLLLRGALLERNTFTTSHQFVAQIEITQLLDGAMKSDIPMSNTEDSPDDEDIWMTIAREEMEKAGIRPRGKRTQLAPPIEKPDARVEHIRSLYESYFVLGPSELNVPEYGITHVSPSLKSSYPQACQTFRDAFPRHAHAIHALLSEGRRFMWKIKEHSGGDAQWICCIPMFGPDLNCWLCFLIDESRLI
ncbi:hypothetical protein MMC24_001397 [Lignoscripta atroalba]|nr:hypothetical protein [Lignoscripta atroalba]